jgi:hypothetical protein
MHGLHGNTSLEAGSSHREPLLPMQPHTIGAWSYQLPPDKITLQGQEVASHASDLYASGELPSPRVFAFSKTKIRIDWRALAGIDIDYVVCSLRCLGQLPCLCAGMLCVRQSQSSTMLLPLFSRPFLLVHFHPLRSTRTELQM